MDCQRVIHGPGTGVVGPVPEYFDDDGYWTLRTGTTHRCALCRKPASPYNIMRLWADEDEPDELGLGW